MTPWLNWQQGWRDEARAMTADHLERIVAGREAKAPVLPQLDRVSVILLQPLCFGGKRVEPGEMVEVDGYDAPTLLARGVARAV